jgi:muconolactone delta-isomerase
MKFLRILRNTEVYYSLPAEKRAELSTSAYTFAEKHLKSGKLKEFYFMSDMKGGFAIWDVSSTEELARFTMEYPMAPYTDFETYPLVEYDAVAKMRK